MMPGQQGFWDFGQRLEELSKEGDPLERLNETVDFEMFRPILLRALRRGRKRRGPGGRPPYDPVLKFKMLVLQALHGLSRTQTSYLVRGRLSWMRFCGLGPGEAVPDENTLWDFREALIVAKALDKLFARLDRAITKAGYLPMGGQIIDARLVAAPKQRNTEAKKADIKAGRIPKEWGDKPAKMGGQAGETAPEGSRCALDGEVRQGAAARGRQGPARHRPSVLRRQEPYQHRPAARDHPPRQDDRRRS